jgi:hypothetical protein
MLPRASRGRSVQDYHIDADLGSHHSLFMRILPMPGPASAKDGVPRGWCGFGLLNTAQCSLITVSDGPESAPTVKAASAVVWTVALLLRLLLTEAASDSSLADNFRAAHCCQISEWRVAHEVP